MKKKNVRKLSKKGIPLLAAAAMSAMVLCQNGYFVLAEETEISAELNSLLPDNITIEEPTALSNVPLPSSEYGTISWADSSFVPTKRVQSCKVIFKSSGKIDLSHITGWDSESQSFTGKITVVVNSIEGEPTAAPTETPEALPTEVPEEMPGVTETPADVPVETPDVTETPETTPTEAPEVPLTEVPPTEVPPTATPTEIPGVTETPEVPPTEAPETSPTDIPETTPTEMPDVTETPENLLTENPTEAPEASPTDIPEASPTETPDVTETPEVPQTEVPEASPTDIPEATPTETPDVTETPEIPPTETPDVTDAPEIPPTEAPDVTETPEALPTQTLAEPTPTEAPDIFDTPDQPEQEERPDSAADNLTPEEQAARAAENHTSNGITVHGDLPWYVQFRVSGGEEYSFRNAEDADIFKSYEFQLWDLKNNTEYQIPDGQYVSVTVPVKAGYEYSVEHILANGATETIIPSVEGTTMVFSTHSFSPFGIAGSKPIVGGEVADKGYENVAPSTPDATATPTPTAALVPTRAPEATKAPETNLSETGPVVPGGNTVTGENSQTSGQDSSAGSTDNQTSTNNQSSADSGSADSKVSSSGNPAGNSESSNAGSKTQSPRAVKTGDSTVIYPFVILLAVAVIAVIAVVVMKKKK